MSKFQDLNSINVNEKVEKKNELKYLSWAWAWAVFKEHCPDATYEIVKFNGLPYVHDPQTGYMVYTRVTSGGTTHEMWLPVMDGANKAMKSEPYKCKTKYGEKTCDAADMFDINKTIMRCLTKNLAMFGLGLYIYAGEDLPEEEKEKAAEDAKNAERQEILAQYNADPNKYYNDALMAINNAIDLPDLEKIWKHFNGWRSFMKREGFITQEQSKDILQAAKDKNTEFKEQVNEVS